MTKWTKLELRFRVKSLLELRNKWNLIVSYNIFMFIELEPIKESMDNHEDFYRNEGEE